MQWGEQWRDREAWHALHTHGLPAKIYWMARILDLWARVESCCKSPFLSSMCKKSSISGREGGEERGNMWGRWWSATGSTDFILTLKQPPQITKGLFWKKLSGLDCGFGQSLNTTAMKLYHRSVDNFPVKSKSSYNSKSIPHCNFRNQKINKIKSAITRNSNC